MSTKHHSNCSCNCCRSDAYNSGGLKIKNYNDRCVKAQLIGTEQDAEKALESVLRKGFHHMYPSTTLDSLIYFLTEGQTMKDRYEGKSQVNVSDGDVFDLDKGIEIAKARCLDKYHKDFDSVMCNAVEQARILVTLLQHYCTKHQINLSKVPTENDIFYRIYMSGCKDNEGW